MLEQESKMNERNKTERMGQANKMDINGKTKERKEAAELFNLLFSTVPLNDLS